MQPGNRTLIREGVATGLLGAATVAGWFLILDLVMNRPLATPSVLGQVLLWGRSEPIVGGPVRTAVAAYTAVHLIAFVLFGLGVRWLVSLAERHPFALFGLFMVTVAFEGFFAGLMAMLFHGTHGIFPAGSVLAANTLAVAVMGTFLVRRHPGLLGQLLRHPLGS